MEECLHLMYALNFHWNLLVAKKKQKQNFSSLYVDHPCYYCNWSMIVSVPGAVRTV